MATATTTTTTPAPSFVLPTMPEIYRRLPPMATLGTVGFCVLIHVVFQWIFHLSLDHVAMAPDRVVHKFQIYRLFTGALFHFNTIHLVVNMMSTVTIGTALERRYGTIKHGFNSVYAVLLTSLMYLLLAVVLSAMGFHSRQAVGYSSVLFHLLVMECSLTTHLSIQIPMSSRTITIPSSLFPWALLVLIQLLLPRVSFLGHVAGILTGTFQVYGISIPIPTDVYIREMEEWEVLEALVASRTFVECPTTLPEQREPAALAHSIRNGLTLLVGYMKTQLSNPAVIFGGRRRREGGDPTDENTQRGTTASFTLLLDEDDDDDDADNDHRGSGSLDSEPITQMV